MTLNIVLGLRKLLEMNIQMIFIVTDVSIQRELNALSSIIGKVPKVKHQPFLKLRIGLIRKRLKIRNGK